MKTTRTDVLEIAFDEGGPDNGRPVLLQGACDYCDLPTESEGLEKHFRGGYERLLLDGVGHFPHREIAIEDGEGDVTPVFPPADFEPLPAYREYPPPEMEARSRAFAAEMQRRRTTRQFSDRPVPRCVIEACLEAAGTAPSGAHLQPWHFVVVTDPELKRAIRVAAEQAEAEFYATAPSEWLAALAPLGTDAHKPYLETAPYLIAVFAQRYGHTAAGERRTHYYVQESVGIATGFLLAALHHA